MSENNKKQATLTKVRIIWGMLLFIHVALIGIFTWLTAQTGGAASGFATWFLWIGLGMAPVCIVAGFGLRAASYKSSWREHAVTPDGYATANIILMALLAGPVVTNLMLMLESGAMAAHLAIVGVCVLLHAINFPTGKPMQPHEPDIASP